MFLRLIIFFGICFLLVKCSPGNNRTITQKDFTSIVTDIARGWNEGNASIASQYFDEHAVYEEPPGNQIYKGKREIFEFFGGVEGFEIPMKMKWHNLAFNEENQVGFGEYTFAMNSQYHGIVVMKFENGKIAKWREYQYKSALRWEEFSKESLFETVK